MIVGTHSLVLYFGYFRLRRQNAAAGFFASPSHRRDERQSGLSILDLLYPFFVITAS